MADIDGLATRRSKRSTAGNLMAIAMAELGGENIPPEAEEDGDFVGPEDEDEVFDSDFQSTDEEDTQTNDAGETEFLDEETRSRKLVRLRASRATELAASRQKVTFNPQTSSAPTAPGKAAKPRRRVSLGIAVNAETGEVVESVLKRKSRRQSTMLNSQDLHSRLKDAEERKQASLPKKAREVTARLTQGELIAQALDTEEGNILEHRNYLSQEEEKRKRAKVVRRSISGPVLRWISKVEETKVKVTPSLPATVGYGMYAYGSRSYPYQPVRALNGQSYTSVAHRSSNESPMAATTSVSPMDSLQSQSMSSTAGTQSTSVSAAPGSTLTSFSQSFYPYPYPMYPPVTQLAPEERLEKVTKNYLVHEIDQIENVAKPRWEDTMEAIFGNHVKWDEVKVFASKNRPLGKARPVVRCPISGRPASYRDPRTGVPYANAHAYKVLTRILTHEYIWSDQLGCYTADQKMTVK